LTRHVLLREDPVVADFAAFRTTSRHAEPAGRARRREDASMRRMRRRGREAAVLQVPGMLVL